ncbi:MAG: tetratricopeptide repeat protein [Verrucomicrobia bacterium]|nr:MAG: tetratricopeptide repeat protein [Verrucomicrobiota bacterium]
MANLPPLSPARKLLYSVCLTLLTLAVVVGGLEIGLRLAGFGHDAAFLRRWRAPDGTLWWRENRDFTLLYFPREIVRRPQPIRIPVEKSPETFRIFVLGSSAAMGDPEASFSLSRALEKMLSAAYPSVRFEVVNAAITAINSHVVRRIAEDCAEASPDLFIVYEGNNEVIGPFGPAAVIGPFARSALAIRTATALRATRTGQLIEAAARRLGFARVDRTTWGGMSMFLDAAIAADDPRLVHTRRLFRENLEAIIDAARQADAHTLLCTVITNLRDFSHFRSVRDPSLSADAAARWDAHWQQAADALATRKPAIAIEHLQACAEIDPGHAETWFRLGRACLQAGRDTEAAGHLQRALDLDTLRFRTDSGLNEAIRRLADSRPDDSSLVDLAALAAESAAHHIPGDDLLYEHVHLNMQGTLLAAEALFQAVSRELLRQGRISALQAAPDPETIRSRLAFTIYEQALIQRELLARFEKPPFNEKSDNRARLEHCRRVIAAADQILSAPENTAALATLYQTALEAAPTDWILQRNFGMFLLATGHPARAIPLLEQAAAWIDDDPDTLLALARAHEAAGHGQEARRRLDQLRLLEPDYPGLP